MECLTAARLCSITILLGAALLPAPTGTEALVDTKQNMATEQNLVEEIILGIRAVEPPENSQEVEPHIKVFSSNGWAQMGPEDLHHLHHSQDTREADVHRPLQRLSVKVQSGPEEDLDHLYHPLDNAREADVHRPPQKLSVKVQSGPEEDLDHLYHPPDNAREADVHRPPQKLSVKVQSGPEEDLNHIHHS
ncbi:proline-rich acidic protein 1-like [Pogoniulus pusillus]|uniref:proline-rich acidic protein 1-like n=1 Tax=Pogoniulus pusillus TaxID=488313 RepID=UPI0030B975DB